MKILDQFDEEIDVSNGLKTNNGQYIPPWIFNTDSLECKSIVNDIRYGYTTREDFITKIDNDHYECNFCRADTFIVTTEGYDAFIKCPNCGYKIIFLSA